MSDTDAAFLQLAALFAERPEVQQGHMFGSRCLKINGKVFATRQPAHLVFKLPPDAHARALALSGAVRWNPSGRRILREWVAVPAQHTAQFADLAEAAAHFVGGA